MILTQEAFEQLLAWLDKDREQAGRKYEEIRLRLIKLFVCRGALAPEDLADETINRVMRKLQEEDFITNYEGDPAKYFSAVARLIFLEQKRKEVEPLRPPSTPDQNSSVEAEFACLEQCLAHLSPRNREIIIEYYREDKQAKIDNRKRLADRLGIALNALRNRTNRIRLALESCITDCLKKKGH